MCANEILFHNLLSGHIVTQESTNTKTPDVQLVLSNTYNQLIAHGCNPLAVASTFMVMAFSIFAKELSSESYEKVIESMFLNAHSFTQTRLLH